jgi:hypothetical protein
MPRKRHKPEEIVAKLRRVDVLVSQGQSVADAVRGIGVSVNAGGKVHRFPEQKCISEAGNKGPQLGAFSPGIRLASDYPPGCQHWRGVSGAYSD